jgi:GNAT superfamily N-acetyltransferase
MKQAHTENIQIGSEKFSIQHLQSGSEELNEEILKEFCANFQMVFANQPYGQFLFYPSEGKAISAQEAFKTDRAIGKEEIKHFDLKNYPKHPETGESAILWTHPERTLQVFKEKLQNNARMSILRNELGDFIGATCGYQTNLKGAYQHEEWQDEFLYSQVRILKEYRNPNLFINKINHEASSYFSDEISEETIVFCQNCLFLIPEYQGKSIGYQLLNSFLTQLPEEIKKMPVISEVVLGTTLHHRAISKAKSRAISGILNPEKSEKDGERVIIVSNVHSFVDGINELVPSFK